MKIKLSILSAAVLAAGITAFVWPKTEANEKMQTDALYVSPAGSDQNEGTKEKPFRTLKH
ncbi:hypothetical protein ACQKF6_17140, partial [Bacillus velezensis]